MTTYSLYDVICKTVGEFAPTGSLSGDDFERFLAQKGIEELVNRLVTDIIQQCYFMSSLPASLRELPAVMSSQKEAEKFLKDLMVTVNTALWKEGGI